MIYPHQLFSNPSDSWQRRAEDHRRVLIEAASGHDMRPQMGRTGHTGPLTQTLFVKDLSAGENDGRSE